MKRKWLFLRAMVFVLPLVLMLACGLSATKPTRTPADMTVSSTSTSKAVLPASSTSTSEAVTPTSPPVSIRGLISSWREKGPITGRHIALCQITGDEDELPADCLLMESTVMTDSEGRFEFAGIPPGSYYVLYNSGRQDFATALERWGGETLDWQDSQQQDELFGMDESDEGWALMLTPWDYQAKNKLGLRYFKATLLLGDSPFVLAHDIRTAVEDEVLEWVVVDVVEAQTTEVEFPVVVVFGKGGGSGLFVRLYVPTPGP